jgi:GNAT superfamily N-acetyltransferase
MAVQFHVLPVTPDRCADAEAVFGDCADAKTCYCAYWYLPSALYKSGLGGGNRDWFRTLASQPRPPGVVAYAQDVAAGWCGVAPRAAFDRLRRSRPFAPVDDRPVWSVNCFIVRKPYRGQGLARQLLAGAVDFARQHGAACIEGYPVDQTQRGKASDLYPGALSMFLSAGFVEVARRLPSRPIVRLDLD